MDPYDDLDARFAIHMTSAASAPEKEEPPLETPTSDLYNDDDLDARFAIHIASAAATQDENEPPQAAPSPSKDPYDEEARFFIHQERHKEDEFSEERRFEVHMRQHRPAAPEVIVEPATPDAVPTPWPPPPTAVLASLASQPLKKKPLLVWDEDAAAMLLRPPSPPPAASLPPPPPPRPPSPPAPKAVRVMDIPQAMMRCLETDNAHTLGSMLMTRGLADATADMGRTALWYACFYRSRRCVELLLNKGARPDAEDEQGTRPLHVALWKHGDMHIVGMLRAAGASITSRPERGGLKGMRPIDVARYYKRSETLVSLLEVPSAGAPAPAPASPSRPNKAPITAPTEAVQAAQAAASLAREAAAQAAAVAAAEEEVELESEESLRKLMISSSISKELRTQRAVPVWIGPNGLMKEITARSVDADVDAEDKGGAGEEGEGGESGHTQPSSARPPPRPVNVKRLPSASLNAADAHVSPRRQGGDRGESSDTVPNSTVSLEAQLLMRSQAREERRGISTTRIGAQHGASQHGASQHGAGTGTAGQLPASPKKVVSSGGSSSSASGASTTWAAARMQAREGGGIENASAALMDQLAISARESASRRARDGLERHVEHEGDPRRAERLSGGADGNCSEALLTGPSLVSVLAEEVQHYILAALSVRSAGRAAQVCCTWRALLTPDGAWREICTRTAREAPYLEEAVHAADTAGGAPSPDAGRGGAQDGAHDDLDQAELRAALSLSLGRDADAPPGGFRERALRMHAEALALAARWRQGRCVEDSLHLHAGDILSLVPHRGQLLSASMDGDIKVTPVDGRLRSEADAALTRTGGKAFVPSGVRTLSGHRKEVLHVHAYADHVASCSGDGHVLVWSVAHGGAELLRRWTTWGASCVRLDAADQLTCGGEGTEPITVYNWRSGAVLSTYADGEPPLGVCSCLQREGAVLAAGNTFSHSQVRVWDVSRRSLIAC
jgi:hypothetical protein